MNMASIDSPLGKLSVVFEGENLCQLEIDKQAADLMQVEPVVINNLHSQLDSYFCDKQFKFSIPVHLTGTAFQRRVWQALREIPVGSTVSYGELAEKLHSSPRAVGNACRANPVPIIIPCHRVVGKKGIGGYDGETQGSRLAIKRWLLQHEGVRFS